AQPPAGSGRPRRADAGHQPVDVRLPRRRRPAPRPRRRLARVPRAPLRDGRVRAHDGRPGGVAVACRATRAPAPGRGGGGLSPSGGAPGRRRGAPAPATPARARPESLPVGSTIVEHLKRRVLVLGGAMGTMIQRAGLAEADFRGERFADHPVDLKGANDVLVLTRPDVVASIHEAYLRAGADI